MFKTLQKILDFKGPGRKVERDSPFLPSPLAALCLLLSAAGLIAEAKSVREGAAGNGFIWCESLSGTLTRSRINESISGVVLDQPTETNPLDKIK